MKDIIKVRKFITYDKEAIRKKPVQKHKHGNQHNLPKVQPFRDDQKKQIFLFNLLIPHKQQFLKFRIKENIMLASGEHQSNSLGMLSVHPISNQYGVTRIDKRKQLLSTSVELYDLPVLPLEELVKIIQPKNPTFANLLQKCGNQQSSQFNQEIASKEDINNLTAITQPYDCIVSKLVDQEIITTQRIFNFAYMEMMGITERMYRTYVHETGQQPSPVYYDQSDNYFEQFGAWFSQWPELKQQPIELINYQGEKFEALCTFKQLLIRCNVQNIVYRCSFWIYQVDDCWTNPTRCRLNESHYFSHKLSLKDEKNSLQDSTQFHSPLLRCGVREI